MEDLIEDLYRALIHPHRHNYEVLRSEIIAVFGYDKFRDIQVEAFKKLMS